MPGLTKGLCYTIYWIVAILFNIIIASLYCNISTHMDEFVDESTDKYAAKLPLIITSLVLFSILFALETIRLVKVFEAITYVEYLIVSIIILIVVSCNISLTIAALVCTDDTEISRLTFRLFAALLIAMNTCAFFILMLVVYIQIRAPVHANDPNGSTDGPTVERIMLWTDTKPDIIFNNDIDDTTECSICLINDKNVVYACGHYICCEKCNENICKKTLLCLICRQSVNPMYKFDKPAYNYSTFYSIV